MICVCESKKRETEGTCSTSSDLQRSLFHLSAFNTLPQVGNHFNYSEAIDLLKELTYSNLQQSYNSLLLQHVRSGSSVAHGIAFGTDEMIFCGGARRIVL